MWTFPPFFFFLISFDSLYPFLFDSVSTSLCLFLFFYNLCTVYFDYVSPSIFSVPFFFF
jgi:hypothetical protein